MGFYTVLLVIHTIIVLFLIGIILLQRTDSDGMTGLSGGGGANQFLTGRSKANLLTRTTAILATTFMLTSLTLAVWTNRVTNESIIDKVAIEESFDEADKAPATEAVEAAETEEGSSSSMLAPLADEGDAKGVKVKEEKAEKPADPKKATEPSVPTPE